MTISLQCPICAVSFQKEAGAYNRAVIAGLNVYCGRTCMGLSRRKPERSAEEKKIAKKAYDEQYRENNLEVIKRKKAEYFKEDYAANPEKYRADRQRRMADHVEYCRTPEYKAYKAEYDKKYRAKQEAGEFWEAYLLWVELDNLLDSKKIKYELGLINKSQNRKRQWKNSQQTT